MGVEKMKITLAPDLEKALLRAIAEGVAAVDMVNPKELSKKAAAIHGAIAYLLKKGAVPPLRPASIMLAASSLTGFPKAAAEAYLRSFRDLQTGEEIAVILKAAREKTMLVGLINTAGEQLSSGSLDTEVLSKIFRSTEAQNVTTVISMADRVGSKFSRAPRGVDIPSLPILSEATNGLGGIWVIGGEPGLGKSTLALQLAVDVAPELPVSYHDIDGTGEEWFIDRLRRVFDGDIKKFKRAVHNFYYRSTVGEIYEVIASPKLRPPALLVIDSIQTLPPISKYSQDSTEEWLRRFKDLTKRGYTILLISEKPRSQYGEAGLAGFKGTGAIEYSGSLCGHMIADEDDDNLIKLVLVKNRHGKTKGHVVNLIRDDNKEFWFKEERVKTYVENRHKARRDNHHG